MPPERGRARRRNVFSWRLRPGNQLSPKENCTERPAIVKTMAWTASVCSVGDEIPTLSCRLCCKPPCLSLYIPKYHYSSFASFNLIGYKVLRS